MRSSIGILFVLLAAVGCAPASGKKDAASPVCCSTNPDASPKGCLCEANPKDIVVTGTTCTVSRTVDGQAIDFTGIVVSSCSSS
jgi:hypothetical protein